MHPTTLALFERIRKHKLPRTHGSLKILAGPHHFHVSRSISEASVAITYHESSWSGGEDSLFVYPVSSRLPAQALVLTVDGEGHALILRDIDGGVSVEAVFSGGVYPLVWFKPGTSESRMPIRGLIREAPDCEVAASRLAAETSILISLINTPRKAIIRPAEGADWTKRHRSAVVRATGRAATAFQTVTWELGRRLGADGAPIDGKGHPKALHWCRAHWRAAAEGEPKAEWVDVPFRGGWGWYCWVADSWRGHPDYGIKLQRHEPRMPGDPSRPSMSSSRGGAGGCPAI